MKNFMKKIIAAVLVAAVLVTYGNVSNTAAATAKPQLSTSKIILFEGSKRTIKLENPPTGVRAIWSSKNTKIATASSGKITGIKAGSTTAVCKITYTSGSKKVSSELTVDVEVKAVPKEVSNLAKAHKSANAITTKDNGKMRASLTSQDVTRLMGLAWNLGNSLDACGITNASTVTDYETGWGNTATTQKAIDGIKKYGFNTIRIPVAWSNMISDDGKYTIDVALLNRVEEVMNYAFNNQMYVILNIHYDSGWWGQFGSKDKAVREEAWKRYESFWTQIANRYKGYSDRLVFESANEELGSRLNDEISGVKGILKTSEQYDMVNKINQKFVDTVRASGGNNKSRHLLIAGFNTDIGATSDSRFHMPKDLAANGTDKLSISVHYYTPSPYCIAESDQGWGFRDTWGTKGDISELHFNFDKMSKFYDNGYGVIIGEYGVQSPNKDGVAAFLKEVVTYGTGLGFCPVFWDNGLWYNRINQQFKYNDVAKVFIETSGSKALLIDGAAYTGIAKLPVADESTLKLLYTWEGTFVKNDGTNKLQYYKQDSCSEGLTVKNNSWAYYLYLYADWASMKEPCIKVYVKNEPISKDSSLQIGYVDETDGIMDNGNDVWNDQVAYQSTEGWIEKCIKLNKADLEKYKVLFLSSGNGFTVTKIEIYDLAD